MSHTEINWYRLVLLEQIPAVVWVSGEAGLTLTDTYTQTHTSGTTPQLFASNILYLEFELDSLNNGTRWWTFIIRSDPPDKIQKLKLCFPAVHVVQSTHTHIWMRSQQTVISRTGPPLVIRNSLMIFRKLTFAWKFIKQAVSEPLILMTVHPPPGTPLMITANHITMSCSLRRGLCPFNKITQRHTKYHLGNKGSFCWQNKKDSEAAGVSLRCWRTNTLFFLGRQRHGITDQNCFFLFAFFLCACPFLAYKMHSFAWQTLTLKKKQKNNENYWSRSVLWGDHKPCDLLAE